MRTPKGKRYCSTEAELLQYRYKLKLTLCPHCGRVGYLIGHGFLTGYSETGQEPVLRGRRFFCSNRYRRLGCGRTFSVLLADALFGFMVRTGTLWNYVRGVLGGLSRKAAWERVAPGFSMASAYRLWRRIQEAQARMRSFLFRERPPPDSSAEEPLAQLFAHLLIVFPSGCPFSSFQDRFQAPLLS